MTAPDPFALGGRQDDAELVAADQRSAALLPQFVLGDLDDATGAALCTAIYAEVEIINATPPKTMLGAAIKLRVLSSPVVGMEVGERDDDLPSLRQVAEFIDERLWNAPDPA
jgi:hypothetical protein